MPGFAALLSARGNRTAVQTADNNHDSPDNGEGEVVGMAQGAAAGWEG